MPRTPRPKPSPEPTEEINDAIAIERRLTDQTDDLLSILHQQIVMAHNRAAKSECEMDRHACADLIERLVDHYIGLRMTF